MRQQAGERHLQDKYKNIAKRQSSLPFFSQLHRFLRLIIKISSRAILNNRFFCCHPRARRYCDETRGSRFFQFFFKFFLDCPIKSGNDRKVFCLDCPIKSGNDRKVFCLDSRVKPENDRKVFCLDCQIKSGNDNRGRGNDNRGRGNLAGLCKSNGIAASARSSVPPRNDRKRGKRVGFYWQVR